MSDSARFVDRAEVRTAIDELVNERLRLTADGQGEADLPEVADYLRSRGIDVPDGVSVRLLRTVHESDMQPLAPLCNGDRARPVNCRWIGKQFVCDWVCP